MLIQFLCHHTGQNCNIGAAIKEGEAFLKAASAGQKLGKLLNNVNNDPRTIS